MKYLAILFLMLTCSGCAGPTRKESLQINAVIAANHAEARAHKITYVEAATRDNAFITKIAGSGLTVDDRLLLSYRLSVASQIDRGQITPETGNYLIEQRIADVTSMRRAELAASSPINCNSMLIGSTVTTSCY